jgi:hypothetical protein
MASTADLCRDTDAGNHLRAQGSHDGKDEICMRLEEEAATRLPTLRRDDVHAALCLASAMSTTKVYDNAS